MPKPSFNAAFTQESDFEKLYGGLNDLSWPKSDWTHEAHFAAALYLVRKMGLAVAKAAMPDIIRAYNQATGVVNDDKSGYHHSITMMSLDVTDKFMAQYSANTPLADILADMMGHEYGHSNWLLKFYTRDTLFSVAARRGWIPPDLG
ncbi:hypothetical protein LPB140_09665 [Sphingorhabdus lutea]|uniref:Uncharacterized protein n=1 Tax=Sphingorhabdus lutea TaxID=1913578 RepID=A0A1L3JD43_9SPHN|nr:hypothetical protein [Sphingorhabdus lutea]APG63009.1 hypothetical protein LPB140_09665 [Sphingorhabdus lutea]